MQKRPHQDAAVYQPDEYWADLIKSDQTNELVGGPCDPLASILSRIDRISCISSHTANGIRAASESHNSKYSSNWNDM